MSPQTEELPMLRPDELGMRFLLHGLDIHGRGLLVFIRWIDWVGSLWLGLLFSMFHSRRFRPSYRLDTGFYVGLIGSGMRVQDYKVTGMGN